VCGGSGQPCCAGIVCFVGSCNTFGECN
jgi:hypothetical protein